MSDVKITDNSKLVLKALESKMDIICEALGLEAAGNAIDEINKLVYDQPQSPNYTRTGRLKNSIAWATNSGDGAPGKPMEPGDSTPQGKPKEGEVYIGTNVEYAVYVEAGSSSNGMAGRPFLKNAIANYGDDYKKIIEDGLKS